MPPDQLERDRRALEAEALLLHKLMGGITAQVFDVVREITSGYEKVAGFLMELLSPTLHDSSQSGDLIMARLLESGVSAACGLAFLHFKLQTHFARRCEACNMARRNVEVSQKVMSKLGTLKNWSLAAFLGEYDPVPMMCSRRPKV